MSEHRAVIRWSHSGGQFLKSQYSRVHTWSFDGGATVPASAAPSNVKGPYTDAAAVDPEEAFVAAIASCHMLMFLWLAAREGVDVLRYEDDAVGRMTPDERGQSWVSVVDLAPRVVYAEGRAPEPAHEADLHHRAHEQCFIANSVRTDIRVRTDVAAPTP